MNRPRTIALVLFGVIMLCVFGLRAGSTQSIVLRRITNTTEEGINLNPSISGDGRILAFESTEDIAHAGGADHFRAIRANVASDPASFFQMGGTRAVTPAISQDGSRIAFASKDDPLGTNTDGNSEIFLLVGSQLTQVTNTSPGDLGSRVTNGNFQPSISDDGRFIAFSSNRNLAGQNPDGNLEIFVYDSAASSFAQLTNTSGIVGSSDAKMSGNGASIAFIRDTGSAPSTRRDLMLQARVSPSTATLLAGNVLSLAMTYGRAISDDGARVVFAAETAPNTTQVFLFDGRGGSNVRQITSLGARVTEVPLHPTISGDGTHIAFAARRSVAGAPANSDGGVELYVLDIPSSQMSKLTNAPSSATADVVSSLNDDGTVAAFSFPRILSGPVANSDFANTSEVYLTGTPARPPFGAITILNGASLGKEPSTTKAVAPDSIAVAIGGALANSTQQSQKLPNGTFPTNVGGTTVTVNGRAAQIFFVSPGQVNFLVPPQTEIGTAEVEITNSENFTSRGTVPTLRAAPGVFTKSGDGSGPGVILNSDTLQEGPFDPTDGNLRLTIFATGARNAAQTSVGIGGRVITPDNVIASPDMPGLDEIHVLVPRDLRGAGTVDLFVQSDGRTSNPVSVTFAGDGTRDILINEVLADPPDQAAGDVNRDGVRDSGDDEFVELVNTTTHDIEISGYQLLSRSSSTTTDTVRHTFAAGTILPACTAAVVFGGGTFDPNNPAFGGALVLKTSTTGGLSLTNGGGSITLRDAAGAIITSFAWGGSTGLNGDANQSMTRSPDVTGNFVLHLAAGDSGGRSYSPGTRVNGNPFALCNPFVRIEVTPASATIDAGAKQQFTAKAFNAAGNEVSGVIFSWQSSNTAVATIDQNGLATSTTAGTTEIRAAARGLQSAPANLTVRDVQRVLTRIDVTPPSAIIPVAGSQQFTAHGIDQFGNEITGLTFTWESTNTSAATVDQTGLANGIAQGQTTIKATAGNVTGTATLTVSPPTIVVNEVLADPPAGAEGDANHDGARDSADDEFVELVNSTSGGINVSGWTLRTHSTSSSTETVRHTFAANTNLPAGEALVVFGGGTFNSSNSVFGCAQVVKASSGGLSLTNGGLTIVVRDNAGNLVTQFPYGGTTGLNGGNAQSLTRSPDVTGAFVLHSTPPAAAGRKFSPGIKLDGTPFGNCTLLSINDVTANEGNSGTTTFTFTVSLSTPAPTGGVSFDIATQDNTATVANNDYVARSLTAQTIPAGQQTYSFDVTVNGDAVVEPAETFFVNVSNVTGALVGDAQGLGTISNDDSPSLSINDVSANEGNAGATTFTFTVTSTLPAPAGGITFDIATQNNTATAGSDYEARSLTSQTIPAGQTTYTFDVTVTGDTLFEPNETFNVNLTNASGATLADGQGLGTIQNDDTSNLVISQTYPGGGLTGATYANDYIELFNRGTATIDFAITPYSVQFLSTGGSTWAKTDLTSGAVAPGGYFLIRESGGANGSALPTADATGTLNLTSTTAGKVALVLGTTLLTGNCPGDDNTVPLNPVNGALADFVGYGGTAATANHCYEGSGPASFTLSNNTIADFRRAGGCTDTNDNAADLFAASPFPRNSSSPVNNCTAGSPPNLTINDLTVTEGNSGTVIATFTVSLSAAAPSTDVTFDIATQNNTATAGSDYVARTLTSQIIPAGQTSYVFSVTVNGDTAIEPDETFLVNVTNVSGATVTDGQGLGTITNDDLPTLSINDISANEGNTGTTTFSFTVNLSAASSAAVTFDLGTGDNTATVADNDYIPRALTNQIIPAGQISYTFDVTVNGDVNIEPNESFFVNVTNVAGATVLDGQGLGTIQNDDSPVLNINDVAISEGNSGTSTLTFTVTSTLPAPAGGITFDIATADNTATTAGNDYIARSLTSQTIPATQTTYTFDVTIKGDLLVEPNETLFVNLSNASGATIGDGQGLGTITNDDAALLVLSQVYGGGNNSGATFQTDFVEIFNRGTTTVDFTVTPYSVQYASASGTFSGSASNFVSLTLGSLAPGQYYLVKGAGGTTNGAVLPAADATNTSLNMSGTDGKVALVVGTTPATTSAGGCPTNVTVGDLIGYGSANCSETAPTAVLSSTKSALRKAGGCTDTDNNAADFLVPTPFPRNSMSPLNNCAGGAAPNLTINDVTVTEGNSGTTTATFTVSLSTPAQGADVTFDIATTNGSATAPSDYAGKSLTGQIIPAGQTSYTFTVTVNGDTTVEPDETFDVNVSTVVGANLTDGTGTGTISNDDFPTLSINDVSVVEGDSGTTTANFTVSLSAPAPAGGVSFNVNTADDTATTANSDYAAIVNGSGSIAAGNISTSVSVTVNGDTTDEPNETFFVNLSNPSNATIADGQGVGTIQNDDSPPTLSVTDVSQAEGNSLTKTFTFTVQLSAPAKAGGVSFTVNTADGTTNPATAGSDYVAIVNGSGSIPQGSSFATVDVTVNGDTTFESNETFFVNLSNVTGATVTDGQGLGTITNDDTAPAIAIADASIIEGNSGTSLMTFTVMMTGTSQVNATVDYTTADSSATVADTDYDATGGTLTFAPGDTTKTFTVTIHGDTKAEGDEMFLVNLTNPGGGATISDNQAFGTIFLDDPFSVATLNTAYTETFDSLAQTGNSSTTPTAWTRLETGTNANTTYTANTGSSTTGDTYSYGSAAAPTDRALGTLRASTLVPTIGAFYRNATGSTVNTLQISYTGEEWRLGTAGRTDQLDFQYSTDATSLSTGTWTDVNALDFITPVTTTAGAKDGNAAANRTSLSTTITGLAIAPNATFWIRWTDPDASGNDDGLAVDDFSITAGVDTPALSINDVSAAETNAGTTTFNFTVNLTSPAPPGGVNFTINTADGTTNPANAGSDYVAIVNGSGSIAQNGTSTTVSVTVNGDTVVEPDETFFVNISNVTGATVSDGQALGTITNDDAAPSSADLSLTKSVSDSTPNIGQNVIFTVKLSNAGPDSATGVQVTDLLPAGLQYVSSTVTQGSYTSGTGVWALGTVATGTDVATLTITATVLTPGGKVNKAEVTADATPDPDSMPNDATGDDFASILVTGAANVIINEIVTSPPGSPPANANDFIELFNKSGTKTIDISGLVISYRTGASTTTATTFTLPGAVGSGTTTIGPNGYLIISNAAISYGITADFNASGTLDLTAASGGVKIELNGVKLDGLTYNNTSTAPAFFATFGEGTAFTSPTTSGLQDYIRSPNGTDNDTNSTDFKRNGTTASITPKAANP